jgi:hypothetical protein
MTVESRFRDSSKRLINRFGKTRVYIRKVDEVYDMETQTTSSGEELHTIKMFKTNPKESEVKSPNLVDKVVAIMMIAASDIPFKPSVGDQIRDQYLGVDEAYEVMQIKENDAGEQVASWRLVCIMS